MTESADRTESIFASAVALPVAERAVYLDQACAGDPDLRRRVEALVRAHEQTGHLLDRPASGGVAKTQVVIPSSQPGDVIAGRYKLLEAIGEGGMGTVWVAEQTEPVRRKVALKLIKAGMDSKSVLARFEAERQALAVMDHPNIAKVLDGGLTEAGRPFFVMEYVKGVPITEYCDATRLTVPDRLQLFAQVCHAVQHAHQKGIIHRDLKPSNILVAPYDDRPVPKVIDFGLAKAVHQSLTDRTLHTGHEMVLGTPLYMSPEQAQLNNLDVDTRSDIYSLGVLLYELLTGTTPLEKQRFKEAAWDEIKRIIREEEPPRPSTRLSSTHTLPSLAACRHTDPAALTKQIRGELDWMVMKALEKDRTRRYDSANAFAADLQRYLAGEAVVAAPPSARYRLGKFVRKHRAAITTATAFALLLVVGTVVSSWQWMRAHRNAALARANERTAYENASVANQHATVAAEAEARATALATQLQKSLQEESSAREAQSREAERARKEAVRANEATDAAVAARRQTRRSLYVAQMNLAFQAWERAQLGRVLQLLDAQLPGDDEDLRGFEWYYLWRQAHRWEVSIESPRLVSEIVVAADGSTLTLLHADHTITRWSIPGGEPLAKFKLPSTAPTINPGTVNPGMINPGMINPGMINPGMFSPGMFSPGMFGPRVALSPDGHRVAAQSSSQGVIDVWDFQSQRKEFSLAANGATQALAFAPDSTRLVVVDGARRVNCWSLASRETVWDVELQPALAPAETPQLPIQFIEFSPDGRFFVLGDNRGMSLYRSEDGSQVVQQQGYIPSLLLGRRVSFSANSQRLAYFGADQKLVVRSLSDEGAPEIREANSRPAPFARGLCLSPDGQRVVILGSSLECRQTDTLEVLASEREPRQSLFCCAWSPDGSLLALGGLDGQIVLRDAVTLAVHGKLPAHTGNLVDLTFLRDGQRLVSRANDGRVRLWDLNAFLPPASPIELPAPVAGLVFDAKSDSLTAIDERGNLNRYEIPTGQSRVLNAPQPPVPPSPHPLLGPVFSRDGSAVAYQDRAGAVHAYDCDSGSELLQFKPTRALASLLAFSPDGRLLASYSSIEGLVVRELPSGVERFRHRPPLAADLSPLTFIGGGRTIVVVDAMTIHLFDVAEARLRKTLDRSGQTTRVHANPSVMAVSPDQQLLNLASLSSLPGTESLEWVDLETGKVLAALSPYKTGIAALAYSPDGRTLATRGALDDSQLKLWNAVLREELTTLGSASGSASGAAHHRSSVAFSPDGRRLATLDDAGRIEVYRAATNAEIESLRRRFVPDSLPSPNTPISVDQAPAASQNTAEKSDQRVNIGG